MIYSAKSRIKGTLEIYHAFIREIRDNIDVNSDADDWQHVDVATTATTPTTTPTPTTTTTAQLSVRNVLVFLMCNFLINTCLIC